MEPREGPREGAGEGEEQPIPRIMMIDDEISNLQVVKIILTRENFPSQLILFEKGEEALDYLRNETVDLILLDLSMPGLNGFDVMARLKDHPATAEIPVIFLSAYTETEYILKAFSMGATDFIGKPIISPILTARIRHIIRARTLQNELLRSNDELVDTNRLKDELLSICSHDLRAPLSSIELICQFLGDAVAGRTDQSMPELITRIVSQSRLARRLVENLLDLNRIEAGRLLPTPSFFLLDELVNRCLDDERPTLEAKGLALRLGLPEQPWLCFADHEIISQVIHNVLNNATKFARTAISLEVEVRDFSLEQGGRLAIVVCDDGPGIPPEQHEAVFEKYHKLEAQGGGSGLGLFIARQMVELHQGSIAIDPAHREGSRFVIELPHVFSPGQLPDLEAVQEQPVLIVSSTRSTAQLLEGVLVEGGLLESRQVLSTAELEAGFADGSPALVVVDLQSGLLLRQLAKIVNRQPPKTRWIVYGTVEEAQEFGRLVREPVVHLVPPLNPMVFLGRVVELLRGEGSPSVSLSV
jgi:signal transduction histidine kinase